MQLRNYYLYFIAFFNCYISSAQNYSISTFDHTWCTTSYPAAYHTGSWSIAETNITGNAGLSKNQSAKTFILDLPSGFEFNTSSVTAAVTIGPSGVGADASYDFTSVSFAFTSVTRITVTLTAKNQQLEYNTLDFQNFEIRAATPAVGYITRTGGTFQVDNSASTPGPAESFGFLGAAAPYTYSATTITQVQDGVNVPQYTINNQILQIKISGTGSCSGNLSQINLNTLGMPGTDLPSNISMAKVYYTGSSSTFATTNLYGSVVSPNGAFSITGTQQLANGNNYFWLTYDVPGDANTDAITPLNRIDAQLVSFILNGSTINTSFTTPDPAGHRPVVGATFYYSREDGTWNNSTTRWATTDGGASCSCQPNGSGVAVIQHAITVDVARTIDVIELGTGASLSHNGTDKNLTVNSSLNTFGTGYFDLRSAPLTVNGNLRLSGSGTSSNSKAIDIGGDVTIGSGTILQSSTNNLHINIGGSLSVHGTLRHNAGSGDIYMDGGNVTLTGTGTIGPARTFIINAGNKTIPAAATFTVSAPVSIQGAYTITNNGAITLSGNLEGNNASSQWTNAVNSSLSYAGSSAMFSTNGKLDALASGNTVNYNRAGNQTINRPANSGQYYNLTLSGSGTKSLDLGISVKGNWVNNATFSAATHAVLLNGNSSQNISGSSSVAFASLELDNSTAGNAIVLNTPISVDGILTLTDGHMVTSSTNILTVGPSGSFILNSSVQDSSFIKGPMKHTVNVSTSVTKVFPIGKNNSYRRADLIIDQIVATSTEYSAEMFNNPAIALGNALAGTIAAVSGMRYFQINQSPSTALNSAQVRLYFGCSGATDDVESLSDLAVAKDNASAIWVDLAGTASGSVCSGADYSGAILSGTFTTFSKFTLANKLGGGNPLPVTLLSFDANQNTGKVDISWSTASEFNSDYFIVQRSRDGILFENVIQVKAAGNSSIIKDYLSYDHEPYAGFSYYRLKQVDNNGKFTLSKPISVNFKTENGTVIYPNPAAGEFSVAMNAIPGDKVLIILRDMVGQELYSDVVIVSKVREVVTISPLKVLPGVYAVEVYSNNGFSREKVIIK